MRAAATDRVHGQESVPHKKSTSNVRLGRVCCGQQEAGHPSQPLLFTANDSRSKHQNSDRVFHTHTS